jgi:hypothetical protein
VRNVRGLDLFRVAAFREPTPYQKRRAQFLFDVKDLSWHGRRKPICEVDLPEKQKPSIAMSDPGVRLRRVVHSAP